MTQMSNNILYQRKAFSSAVKFTIKFTKKENVKIMMQIN